MPHWFETGLPDPWYQPIGQETYGIRISQAAADLAAAGVSLA